MPEETIPKWARQTEEECSYQLVMWQPDGDAAEGEFITRAEYVALKAILATKRGYYPDELQAAEALREED